MLVTKGSPAPGAAFFFLRAGVKNARGFVPRELTRRDATHRQAHSFFSVSAGFNLDAFTVK